MPNQNGNTTEPQQITVAQLAAQLSKKTPSGAKPNGSTPASGATATEEAPVVATTELQPELLNASEVGPEGTTQTETGETGETTPLREQQTQAEVTAEAGPGEGDEPAAPEWYEKRVAKFTAQQKKLEERLAAAEKRAEEAAAKLDENRQQQTGKTKAWNHREQQLQQQLTHKRDVLRWAEENPDGATLNDDKGEVQYTPEQVRAIKLSALEDIGDLRGQLRQHQAGVAEAREHWDAEAVKAYPELKDPKSEISQNIDLMLEKLPWLKEVPDARISLADMVAGRNARLKKAKTTSTNAATTATPTRVPTTTRTAPARSAEAEPSQQEKEASETFQQSGRTSDLARRFALQRKV
jgi:hypothetical protein